MERATDDLARIVPRLVAVWRGLRRRGPASPRDRRRAAPIDGRLSPEELRDVAGGVARLSTGLTRERALAGRGYMDDPRLLGAYLLFYWPISYLQARGVFSELPRRPGAVLDLGSGPAPVAFAALDAGASEVVAADRSAPALAAARSIAAELGQPLATRAWDPTRGGRSGLADVAPGRTFDTVTLGHVLNELFQGGGASVRTEPVEVRVDRHALDPARSGAVERRAALLEEAAALLRPGGSLVVIEPALRDTSRQLLHVRDRLVARGFAVRAPCLFTGACPALLRETDWCHAERAIDPPPLVAEIARAAGLRKEAVKMSYLVVAPKGEPWASPPPGRVFRIVSEPLPSKGRLRYMACGPEGRMGLALQEKHVNERNRPFEKLLRGDVVSVSDAEPRGDGLRLAEASEVKVVARAGQPVSRR